MSYPKQRKINIKDPYGKITTHFILALKENDTLFLSGYIDLTAAPPPNDYRVITYFGDIPTTIDKLMVAVNTLTPENNQIGVNCKLQADQMTIQLTPELSKYPKIRLCFNWIIPL